MVGGDEGGLYIEGDGDEHDFGEAAGGEGEKDRGVGAG